MYDNLKRKLKKIFKETKNKILFPEIRLTRLFEPCHKQKILEKNINVFVMSELYTSNRS
jgi:hypothetical protein